MGSWNRISQQAMVPLLVPAGRNKAARSPGKRTRTRKAPGLGQTQAEPALVHVHAEGGDEAEPQVVPQRPGVAVGAQVPAHQAAVHRGVGQHRLGAAVEVVDVHSTAVFLQVQSPGTRQQNAFNPPDVRGKRSFVFFIFSHFGSDVSGP